MPARTTCPAGISRWRPAHLRRTAADGLSAEEEQAAGSWQSAGGRVRLVRWFGDYNPSQTVNQFDQLYRTHLANLYQLLNVEAPAYLGKSSPGAATPAAAASCASTARPVDDSVDYRQGGVLLHLTSLPGAGYCGDFGDDARRFVELIAAAGLRCGKLLLGPDHPDGCPFTSLLRARWQPRPDRPAVAGGPGLADAGAGARGQADPRQQAAGPGHRLRRVSSTSWKLGGGRPWWRLRRVPGGQRLLAGGLRALPRLSTRQGKRHGPNGRPARPRPGGLRPGPTLGAPRPACASASSFFFTASGTNCASTPTSAAYCCSATSHLRAWKARTCGPTATCSSWTQAASH